MQKDFWNNEEIVKIINQGGVVIMPTDTIYGMMGNALSPTLVSRVYAIRKRDTKKPFIILIGNMYELKKFSINISKEQEDKIKEYWFTENRPTSIVLDCPEEKFEYLHRGTKTLAFRVPEEEGLRELLMKVGPLIAPSANTEKFPASENVQDAKNYFGDQVDLYVDGGQIVSKASRVIRLHKDGTTSILRE